MHTEILFDLIYNALPQDFDKLYLKNVDTALLQENPLKAYAKALRTCDRIDWDAYLNAYPDVMDAKIDPVEHFLNDGIFEGRLLFTKKNAASKPESTAKRPKISIISPNYNNGLYLEKSIGSLIGQTMKDIEIIVVDDASTDDSLDILKKLVRRDPRIKAIALKNRQSQHIARKIGVQAATGEYIMFLDPDDFYLTNACEIAYNAIKEKYDFVCFCSNIIFLDKADDEFKKRFEAYLNRGPVRSYKGNEIMEALYQNYQMNELLWNKIYKSELCKEAFSCMENDFIPRGQDNYEALAIVSLAKNAAKINERLYVYRKGQGVSTSVYTEESVKAFASAAHVYGYMAKFMEQTGNMQFLNFWTPAFISQSLGAWLKYAGPRTCRDYFDDMAKNYGIVTLMNYILDNHSNDWEKIADKFQYYGNKQPISKKVKSVGILYSVMGNGGAERVTWELAPLLVKYGYSVTVFLETAHENDERFKPPIKVVYMGGGSGPTLKRSKDLLRGLYNEIRQNPVDVMLCHACYDKSLLWYVMLLKYLGTAIFMFPHSAFFRRIMQPNAYLEQAHPAILRCADMAPVLSHYEEAYYHLAGVNAHYVSNPIRLPEPDWIPPYNFEKRRNNLIVFGRLGEPNKQASECLKILAEVKKELRWIKMTFIGSFTDKKMEFSFYNLAKKLNVIDNIYVTGWLESPYEYIDGSAVLVSAAWHEAFPLSISECQGRGVPVVMYELPIEVAVDNPSIIRVPHGNVQDAAKEIVNLLRNEEQWLELSTYALRKMREYSSENYINNINELLNSYNIKNENNKYKPEDYRVIMRTLAFYGMHLPPWVN